MKTILLIIVFILTSFNVRAGKTDKVKYHIEIDTLRRMHDSIYAVIRQYRNDTLEVKGTAFIIRFCEKTPATRISRIFSKNLYCEDRVIRHGLTTEYFPNGESKTTWITMGILGETNYYNSLGGRIQQQDFQSGHNVRDGCRICRGLILIEGTKKVGEVNATHK